MISELARSDRRVSELSAALAQPQNAVSYHLAQLRCAGVISSRRSSADGRDSYYPLDSARLEALLEAAASAVRPTRTPSRRQPRAAAGDPLRVLFLCTGNSGRSQIAEARLQQAGQDHVLVASAGSRPKPIHPGAIRVLRSHNIDISDRRSKHLDEFTEQRFDIVITLCDKVREVCPTFPGHPDMIHWSIPDPAAAEGRGATRAVFTAVAVDLQVRVNHLVTWALPHAA